MIYVTGEASFWLALPVGHVRRSDAFHQDRGGPKLDLPQRISIGR